MSLYTQLQGQMINLKWSAAFIKTHVWGWLLDLFTIAHVNIIKFRQLQVVRIRQNHIGVIMKLIFLNAHIFYYVCILGHE